ncbi:hypothetical protein [Rubritalea tangerina]
MVYFLRLRGMAEERWWISNFGYRKLAFRGWWLQENSQTFLLRLG